MRRGFRYFVPTPRDAWVLLAVLLGTFAVTFSALLQVQTTMGGFAEFLTMVLVGVLIGMAFSAIFHRVSIRALFGLIAIATFSVVVFVYAGTLLEMTGLLRVPSDLSGDANRVDADASLALLWQRWARLRNPMLPMLMFLVVQSFGCTESVRITLGRLSSRLVSWSWDHRLGLMVGFLVIAIPAGILRNVFDDQNLSGRYLLSGFLAVAALLVIVLASRLIMHVIHTRLGFALVFWCGVLGTLSYGGWAIYQELWDSLRYNPQLAGKLGEAMFPAFALLGALGCVPQSSVREPDKPTPRRVSATSLLAVNLAILAILVPASQLDLTVPARLLTTQPRQLFELTSIRCRICRKGTSTFSRMLAEHRCQEFSSTHTRRYGRTNVFKD